MRSKNARAVFHMLPVTLLVAAAAGAIVVALLGVALGASPSKPVNVAGVWLLFRGDFETGNLSQWNTVLPRATSSCSVAVYSVKDSPPGAPNPRQGRYAAAFRTSNSCPGSNVRTQVQTDAIFKQGDDVWFGWSTYFPRTFPKVYDSSGGFFGFMSSFGGPYTGSSNNAMSVFTEADGRTYFERRYSDGHQLWKAPLIKGEWTDFVRHIHFSEDPGVGFDELWVNGTQQRYAPAAGTRGVKLAINSSRVYLATMASDATNKYDFSLSNYRRRNEIAGTVTIYQDAARVGSTYAAVAPDASGASG